MHYRKTRPDGTTVTLDTGGTGRENKYHAQKVTIGEHTFDSRIEMRRYVQLRQMEAAGEISHLKLQPYFEFVVNGVKIASYYADFEYVNCDGRRVVEDVKSQPTKTPVYRLKKKLMLALYEITIQEWPPSPTKERLTPKRAVTPARRSRSWQPNSQ